MTESAPKDFTKCDILPTLILRIEHGLPTLANWYFWIGTYLGKKPPTVRHYQTLSFPTCPAVLDLILDLKLLDH